MNPRNLDRLPIGPAGKDPTGGTRACILVTGGAGYVGSHAVLELLDTELKLEATKWIGVLAIGFALGFGTASYWQRDRGKQVSGEGPWKGVSGPWSTMPRDSNDKRSDEQYAKG